MKVSAFWKRQPFGSPLRLPMADDERYGSLADAELPSASTVAIALYCRSKTSVYLFLSTSVAPYSIIPSILNWRSCEVLSNYHFGPREAGKSLTNFSSRDAFNAQNTCRPFVGPIPSEGVALSSLHFSFLYIYSAPSSFSFISSLLIIERDRERDCRLLLRWLSFRHFIFHHLIFRQSSGLSSRYLLTVSFHFLTFFIVVK